MAKEISCSIKLSISPKGSSKASGEASSQEDIAAGGGGFQATIGSSSAAAISLGGLTAPKVVFIQNNDPDNPLTVDHVSSLDAWPQVIPPGTGILLRPPNGIIFGKATSAPVNAWIVAG